MAGFDSKIKVEIATVLNNNFPLFHLINKDASEIDFTFFVALYSIISSIEENRMGKDVTDSLDVDEDRPISSHHIAVHVVVE